MMATIFWLSVAGVLFPYFGYPLVLVGLRALAGRRVPDGAAITPTITMIIPVHNEAARIDRKVRNTAALEYPADHLQVLFVSDGSTDDTVARIRAAATPAMTVIELAGRGGKAAALNAGLAAATHEVLVFSDASIELEPGSLRRLVQPFRDPSVGCVSGEDRIGDGGGEGLYGRYELALRRLESAVHSIVGASGSFYAQRRALCQPFTEGLAPDFLSVLRTVEQGARALSEESAIGYMTSVKDPRREFERKVRTLLRGLTTLWDYRHLLNPFRSGTFAFLLFGHKVLRWTAPLFLVGAFVSAAALAAHPFYLFALVVQAAFYLAAAGALKQRFGLHESSLGRIALYFSASNAAVLVAWMQFFRGVRQELWTPSQR